LIALQKKIDGQSLANFDDVPWYGVGPSEPTPIPILGPDIVDPRQMELIRRQAEKAARGEAYGVRELPEHRFIDDAPRITDQAVAQPGGGRAAAAIAASTETVEGDAELAEMRRKKRMEALQRKRDRVAEKS
jgi:hypothetical protein